MAEQQISRRGMVTAISTAFASISVIGTTAVITQLNGDSVDRTNAEAVIKAYYEKQDGVSFESIHQRNRDDLPGNTIDVVVTTSAGEQRVILENRNKGWVIVEVIEDMYW
jgi:hypothetical protein